MIQPPRSETSQSLLREAEDAVVVVEDDFVAKFLRRKILEVAQKRKEQRSATGATEARRHILSYLESRGDIHTVNIWMRGFIFEQMDQLKSMVQEAIQKAGGEGVFEIHLQDREIMSPHIQYVGTHAEEVEKAIADVVVKLGYESDLSSAMSKNATPAYMEVTGLRARKIKEEREEREEYERRRAFYEKHKDFFETIKRYREEFRSNIAVIEESIKKAREGLKRYMRKREEKRAMRKRSLDELLESYKKRKDKR